MLSQMIRTLQERVFELDGDSSMLVPHSKQWWLDYLRGSKAPVFGNNPDIGIVDLFSSVGGLSIGANVALSQLGLNAKTMGAVDLDKDALSVYEANLGVEQSFPEDLESLVDYKVSGQGPSAKFQYAPDFTVDGLNSLVGNVPVVLAGPPCQGHSNLNNHTRRDDPRNRLYLAAVAAAVALNAEMVVIENVPEVRKSVAEVVSAATHLFQSEGYFVSDGILDASELGAPQKRRRHFLIATRWNHFPLVEAKEDYAQPPSKVWDAIADLEHEVNVDSMTRLSSTSPVNQRRIDYLFDNGLNNLPNSERPDCHKNGHTYPSVYGRMYANRPAQTITGGFMSPGRGRFIHPTQRRVITPREAARIQGFPDWFSFDLENAVPTRKQLSKWIGDAVPSQLAYHAMLAALTRR